ncbi:MAG: sarcosine oxidase subunit gamma [Pseudomonadota bacterium]
MLKTPILYALVVKEPRWTDFNGMSVALGYESEKIELERQQIAGICDVSCLQRFGVKGPNAEQWLGQRNIALPAGNNSWASSGTGEDASLVLRLGSSEFLIEQQLNNTSNGLPDDGSLSQPIAAGVYRVQRNDAAFILSGSRIQDLLSELCLLDLRDKALAGDAVVMTQVAGISATLLRQPAPGKQSGMVFRLWCDGSYGAYMWQTLTQLADELGGGAVGLATYL